MDYMELIKLAIPLLAVGGAWGGAKAAINGTKARQDRLEDELKDHLHDDVELQRTLADRMARMETKIDILLENNNAG